MKSILEGRSELKAVIDQIAEVTGYLWQKGWAERNGGNITVNVTEYMDEACRALPAISKPVSIGLTLPHLKGKYFYCKGTGKRMRDLAPICSRPAAATRPRSTRIPSSWWP